jgi:hypothetical protein
VHPAECASRFSGCRFRRSKAALRILEGELAAMLSTQDDPAKAIAQMRRFGDLIHGTRSLRAYQSNVMDHFVTVATEISPCEPG